MSSAEPESRLEARIETGIPQTLAAERPNAILIAGACADRERPLAALEIVIDGRSNPATAHSIPRPDLEADRGRRWARSGFWGIAELPATRSPRPIEVELVATLDDGTRARLPLGEIELIRPAYPEATEPAARIAICMATYEPPPKLLERQIESIRRQSNRDWICLISDDCSSAAGIATIEALVGKDPRFVVSRQASRAGFFHNFERALRMAPAEAEFIALADQDDRWDPDKLDRLLEAIGSASLVYSDARVVTEHGELLYPTYWSHRANNHTDLISMLLANTVSGSAALFHRRVLDLALPFPPAFGGLYHDHWMALVGLATGEVAYLDRALYDYVQHDDAVLGHERSQAWGLGGRGLRERLAHFRADPDYFYGHWRTTYFREYCRVAVMARLLLTRCGPRLSASRRRPLELLADAERSARAPAWLAARQLRRLTGRTETVGAEGRLLRALAWRRLLEAGPGARRVAGGWLPRQGGFPAERVAPTAPAPLPAPPPVRG